MHCENGHTLESCEITATIALYAICSPKSETVLIALLVFYVLGISVDILLSILCRG